VTVNRTKLKLRAIARQGLFFQAFLRTSEAGSDMAIARSEPGSFRTLLAQAAEATQRTQSTHLLTGFWAGTRIHSDKKKGACRYLRSGRYLGWPSRGCAVSFSQLHRTRLRLARSVTVRFALAGMAGLISVDRLRCVWCLVVQRGFGRNGGSRGPSRRLGHSPSGGRLAQSAFLEPRKTQKSGPGFLASWNV
jgi:hypothetical protein